MNHGQSIGARSEGEQETFDFTSLLAFVRRYWLVLGAAALLSAVVAYGVSYLFPRTYRAATVLTPVSGEEANSPLQALASRYGALAGLVGIDLGGGDYSTAAVIALLKSRDFIETFIAERELLPVLFWKRWDAEKRQWKGNDDPPPSLQDGYEYFTRNIMSVAEDRKTGLVTVAIEWRNNVQAAEWANALVEGVNARTRQLAIDNAAKSIDYLTREAKRAESVELRQSIFSLLESQMNKRMLAITRPDFAFRVIDPAKPSQPYRYVKPRRVRFALFGFVLGGLVTLAIVSAREVRRRTTART